MPAWVCAFTLLASSSAAASGNRAHHRPQQTSVRRGEAPPAGYVEEQHIRLEFLLPGAGAMVAAYLPGLAIASSTGYTNHSQMLIVPVVGPWITLAQREDTCPSDSLIRCGLGAWAGEILVLDGLIQTVGLALMVTGVVWPRTVWVLDDSAQLTITPWLSSPTLANNSPTAGLTFTLVQ